MLSEQFLCEEKRQIRFSYFCLWNKPHPQTRLLKFKWSIPGVLTDPKAKDISHRVSSYISQCRR